MPQAYLSLLAILALAPSALAAEPVASCEDRGVALKLDETLHDAEQAFRALEVDTFNTQLDQIEQQLPCVAERISASVAARLHRLQGIRHYLMGDKDKAILGFASARAADGSLTMDLVSAGHELELLFGQLPPETGTEHVPPAKVGTIYLDGLAAVARPADRPVLAQWIEGDANPNFTVWSQPGEALPDYPKAPAKLIGQDPRGKRIRRKIGLGILGGGAVAAISAGALYGSASASRASFMGDQPTWGLDDLRKSQDRTNGLADAALISGGAAVVLASTGLVLQW